MPQEARRGKKPCHCLWINWKCPLGGYRPLNGRAFAKEMDAQDQDDDNGHIQTDIHQILLKEFLPSVFGHEFQLMG